MTAKKDNHSTEVTTPPTYAGEKLPAGKVKVTATDPALVKTFLGSSNQFEVTQKPKQDEGMDLLTLYMLFNEDKQGINGEKTDTDFVKSFAAFVKMLPPELQNEKVMYDGKLITLGEMADKLSTQFSRDMTFSNYPQGILGHTRLSPGSPLSAKAIEKAEQLAQSKGVLGVIQKASEIVGIDPTYMLLKAKQESGFNPNAQARTSSAGGLYQFLDSTWLTTVKNHKGLIENNMPGIDIDTMSRKDILALKTNAYASALMGAAYAKDNKQYLENSLPGFEANSGALYMAHFLGPAGAKKLYEHMMKDPTASAAALFPQAAAANKSVFGGGTTLADLGSWAANKVGAPHLIPS